MRFIRGFTGVGLGVALIVAGATDAPSVFIYVIGGALILYGLLPFAGAQKDPDSGR